MKTKTILSTSLGPAALALGAAVAGAFSCAAELQSGCPEGTVQTAGGGDVSEACTPGGQLSGSGGASGEGGAGGGAPSMGSGGGGGGVLPVPPGGECNPNATKCGAEGQQTCGTDGKWGAAAACDIACDTAGSTCVVPVQVGVGDSFACARLSDETVRCWGSDSFGNLGNGASPASTTPVAVQGVASAKELIVNNGYSACVVLADGSASCWGYLVGTQDVDSEVSPVSLGLTDVAALVPNQNSFFDTFSAYMCAVKTGTGEVLCGGGNNFGQLGDSTQAPNSSNSERKPFTATEGLDGAATQIAVGETHACALTQNGDVFCWGAGFNGQNGDESFDHRLSATKLASLSGISKVAAGGDFSCALRSDKNVACWGRDNGRLGQGASDEEKNASPRTVKNLGDVKGLDLGESHACALKNDGTLWCWGTNEEGELGASCGGTCADQNLPVKADVVDVMTFSAGAQSTCVITSKNVLLCWGRNDAGQLGTGVVSDYESVPQQVKWK